MTVTKTLVLAAILALPFATRADLTLHDADSAVATMRKTDPSLKKFFHNAVGYAVFPNVAKGGLGLGGAGGSGFVFENGKAVGKTTLAQATIGAQVGGQTYYEIIFFQTKQSLADFEKGEWTMDAQATAVALKSGASADAAYNSGVAVFTLTKGGAMAEASVGGQRFTYEPLNSHK